MLHLQLVPHRKETDNDRYVARVGTTPMMLVDHLEWEPNQHKPIPRDSYRGVLPTHCDDSLIIHLDYSQRWNYWLMAGGKSSPNLPSCWCFLTEMGPKQNVPSGGGHAKNQITHTIIIYILDEAPKSNQNTIFENLCQMTLSTVSLLCAFD